MGIIKDTQSFMDSLNEEVVFDNMNYDTKNIFIANYLIGLDKKINYDVLRDIIQNYLLKILLMISVKS